MATTIRPDSVRRNAILDDAVVVGPLPVAESDGSDASRAVGAGSATEADIEPTFRQMIRPFWFVGALLMMLDGLTTYLALTYHADAGAREGNPLAQWAIDHIGVAGMCSAKVVIGVVMMWRLAAAADRGHRFTFLNRGLGFRQRPLWKVRRNAAWTLALSLVLMGVVVGNNLRAIVTLAGR